MRAHSREREKESTQTERERERPCCAEGQRFLISLWLSPKVCCSSRWGLSSRFHSARERRGGRREEGERKREEKRDSEERSNRAEDRQERKGVREGTKQERRENRIVEERNEEGRKRTVRLRPALIHYHHSPTPAPANTKPHSMFASCTANLRRGTFLEPRSKRDQVLSVFRIFQTSFDTIDLALGFACVVDAAELLGNILRGGVPFPSDTQRPCCDTTLHLWRRLNSTLPQQNDKAQAAEQSPYDMSLYLTTDAKLKNYLTNVVSQLKGNIIYAIEVKPSSPTNEVLERWQFDIECDKTAKQSREKSIKAIQEEIRSVIRQITATVTFLPLLETACKSCHYTMQTLCHTAHRPGKREQRAGTQGLSTLLVGVVVVVELTGCAFDLLIYTDKDLQVPEKWEESGPQMIADSEEVRLRSFTTTIHKVNSMVAYKRTDSM
ncbi:hypothetical protein JZ751_008674 [Albula glossodonta]|uniref:HORMA domain-containing protein n=1 Tax=Albula glossodonta TaxID=121402 RepID=A0A8T2P1D7_9TELE|nr:hypothetical protein JZ751_008674 [Albula glossodonta]